VIPDDEPPKKESDAIAFGKLVRARRLALGWSLEALAEAALLNLTRKGYVSQVERGKILNIERETVKKFARALQIDRKLIPASLCWPEAAAFASGGAEEVPRIGPPVRNTPLASNIPIRVPMHFMGRDDAMVEIATALAQHNGRVAITALYGLRGVGKSTLAAAYADRHRGDYRATWWIRAQTESGLRADMIALGVRLGWVSVDDKEEPALAAVMERLRHEGDRILLIYDNAIGADAVKAYLPPGGTARVLVTSNDHAWRGVAAPVEIRLWLKQIGAEFLIARTGRATGRGDAEALSQALGGLPLAHEQAAAYCERLGISLANYRSRLKAAPTQLLDDVRYAPSEYYDGQTVVKTFALAIEEATKLHSAAGSLITHAALLAPEPIPLFVFSKAREEFGEPLATALVGDGLQEVVAALRTFALVDHQEIIDERDSSITTDAIRLHLLVREIAAARSEGKIKEQMQCSLVAALAKLYPHDPMDNPKSWPACASLTPHVVACSGMEIVSAAFDRKRADLLLNLGSYLHRRASYSTARPMFESALATFQQALGPEHRDIAKSLNRLALLLKDEGDLATARSHFERALAMREKVLGPEHPETAQSLDNLSALLQDQGDLVGSCTLQERALAIREKVLGAEHPDTATSLNNLAYVLHELGDPAGSRSLQERALAIREKVLGPDHHSTAESLHDLAVLLEEQGEHTVAQSLLERALAIDQKTLGAEHPGTAVDMSNLAHLLNKVGKPDAAEPLICRAIAIGDKALGSNHPRTQRFKSFYARLLLDTGRATEALSLAESALETHAAVGGSYRSWTKYSAHVTADALVALNRLDEAAIVLERFGLIAK
jgi:tetratricopeptide (TPR) repeat protein/transcriptional regulator with XRE-family HTH domain